MTDTPKRPVGRVASARPQSDIDISLLKELRDQNLPWRTIAERLGVTSNAVRYLYNRWVLGKPARKRAPAPKGG